MERMHLFTSDTILIGHLVKKNDEWTNPVMLCKHQCFFNPKSATRAMMGDVSDISEILDHDYNLNDQL